MARPFGKLVGEFLRTDSTKTYIQILESRYADLHIGGKKEILKQIIK